ncbi:hypothetical protein IE53DRAFT_365088 [Violaceomyces palustris]|uniref:Uncharacterized protein n=1 Tax=Violaceomyces palustris TaxID=1673888 RepID=A0ACD0NM28_9BASI|nr:hypothetical protein IE53DRAFT_365088 [Violaceomyces palustris]
MVKIVIGIDVMHFNINHRINVTITTIIIGSILIANQHRHHHHHHEEKQIHPHPEDSGPSKEVTSGEEMNVNSPEEVAGREGKDQASGKGPVSPPLPVSEPHIPINNGTDHGNPFNDKEEGGDGDGDGNEDVDDADDVSDSPSSPPWNDDDRVAKPPSPKHGGNVGSGGGGGGTPPPSSKPSNDVKSLLGNLFSGQGTFFTPGLGACGETDDEGSMIVAVSDDIFSKYNRNGNPNLNTLCNAQIRIHYKGKTVLVRATDCCPTCNPTSLDLSPAAFNQLESPDVGVLRGMTWEFTGQ